MPEGFLLSRILFRFEDESEDLLGDLSAVTITPDGSLWVGSDELLGIERLYPIEPHIFGNHQHFPLGNFVELFDSEDEIDIEGIEYSHHYLWITGSHSTKRKKAKGKNAEKDIQRLSQIKADSNRYLLARIPVINGELVKVCSNPDDPTEKLTAACLQKTSKGNLLIDALTEDSHLGSIISCSLPSKDNGLDIEGLTVFKNRIFLGLRGPVLRGWAIILELELVESEPGVLTLKEIGESGELYKKHFVDLDGLGVRELCFYGEDLIVLGGPTMALDGALRVFRWKNALQHSGDSICGQDSGELEVLFDLPIKVGTDYAEGLALFPCLQYPDSLLVVYDSPDEIRKPRPKEIFADVFRLI
ncbi:DUF3616 domain-containing protein [Pleurocapsales cyanobacterium LEGE 06147]|nr:DUF3616 domain-containing protein [Pleurocapsales cyanobacterium LEGE 06147]